MTLYTNRSLLGEAAEAACDWFTWHLSDASATEAREEESRWKTEE
jgi:hypothetical protein